MVKTITAHELFEELKKQLAFVHNLKTVFLGKMYVQNSDLSTVQPDPNRKEPIAYGEPDVIDEGVDIIYQLFKNSKPNYDVIMLSNSGTNNNLFYIVLDINTTEDYSIDDLYDDDLITKPYTLIR